MIYLAADHRGYQLKEELETWLLKQGHELEDVGALRYDTADDYVDFARDASQKIAENPSVHKGIFLCGSGIGMAVVADKYRGLHAALVKDRPTAIQSREHGDTNVLVLAADDLDPLKAKDIVSAWLNTPFSGEERHIRRLKKIQEIEERNFQ